MDRKNPGDLTRGKLKGGGDPEKRDSNSELSGINYRELVIG